MTRQDIITRFRDMPKRFSNPPGEVPLIDERMGREIAKRSAICDACDKTDCPLKHCSSCRKRAMLARPAMVCPADPPKWGPVGAASSHPGPLKVVWTISAWNEPLVGATVASLKASVVNDSIDFEVLVIDDASTDGSCDNLDCRVIRNEKPRGIGYNLNLAAEYALREMNADVVGVADAHMKIPPGVIDALARRAMREPCVVSSASYGWEETSKMRQWGAYFVWMKRNCIAARWIGGKWPLIDGEPFHRPKEEWAQVQIPLGAFYAYSRETIGILREPTGRLWETIVGRWGFLLEPFSAKCWLLGVPVYVSRDHYTRHLYRSTNPLKGAHREKVMNTAFGTASIFSEATWKKYFEHWCKTRGGVDRPEIDKLAAQARKGVVRPWTPEDEEDLLENLPEMEEEKKNPVPLEKIILRPPRDKMVRSVSVRKKGALVLGAPART